MTVYVDALVGYGWIVRGRRVASCQLRERCCHMIADTQAELHAMADAIGLRRSWFQEPPKSSIPHYDLVESKRTQALEHGAVELDRRAFVDVVRRLRAAGWP